MQVLTVVSLMTFLVVGLLFFLLLTPRGRGRSGDRKNELHPRSDSHGPAHVQGDKGETL